MSPSARSGAPLALQRHTLVWLDARGWQAALARPDTDPQAHACLSHWADNDLPVVVTRQPAGTAQAWQLGLSAPLQWSRRRLWLSVPVERIARTGSFPPAADIETQLPEAWHGRWRALCAELSATGTDARVYGSHGWQTLSGMNHVSPDSDIDLLLRVDGAGQADVVASVLERAGSDGPRLDGELVFNGGAAAAWREWLAWRRQGRGTILVKRLRSESLDSNLESLA
jgi:phosphoribosyl-dephospho-CoA transferase